ncbi:hypothetical protein KEM55_000525 [Ascosphaera atra]|nr:hypothetical protein KEM55_000525 [Ascosphaera atra]
MPQPRARTRELSPLDILKAGLGLSKERRRARSPVQPETPEEDVPLQGGETRGPGLRSRSKTPADYRHHAGHKERGGSVPVKPAPANARYVYVAPQPHAGRPRSAPRAAALHDPLAGGAVGGGAVDARAFAAPGRERERGVSFGRRQQQQESPGKKRLRRDRFYSWFLT